jgi:hypothetical protein
MEYKINPHKDNNITFGGVMDYLNVYMGRICGWCDVNMGCICNVCDEHSYVYVERICDGCSKNLYIGVDNIYYDNDKDLCDTCINNNNIHKQHKEIIDQKNVSPHIYLNWPCYKCKCMLGGGHKWNLYYRFIDICDTCDKFYDISDIIKKEMKYLSKDDSYIVNNCGYVKI